MSTYQYDMIRVHGHFLPGVRVIGCTCSRQQCDGTEMTVWDRARSSLPGTALRVGFGLKHLYDIHVYRHSYRISEPED